MTVAAGGRPRVLVVAYACEPGKGSEQGVGWNWSMQMARFADVTVITRSNNRSAIEADLATPAGPVPNFVYYDPPAWVRRFKRGARGLYPFYFAWQWGVARLARRLARDGAFTHVHLLTFGSIWLPVFVHRLKGRFVWGPIGGGEGVPAHLLGTVSMKTKALQRLRQALIATLRVNPMIAPVLKRADLVLVRTEDTMRILPEPVRAKAVCLLETGVDEATLAALVPKERPPREVPEILFTGRLVGFKNVEMLLHAAARARQDGAAFTLRLIGEGPERPALTALTQHLKLQDCTTFVGAVPHAQVLEALRDADIYAFPSLREGGPWSLMEAMCAALPVLCVNTSGMSVITNDNCAIRIDPTSRGEIIAGFAQGITSLCNSQSTRLELGKNARTRMQDVFLWNHKGDEIKQLLFGNSLECGPFKE